MSIIMDAAPEAARAFVEAGTKAEADGVGSVNLVIEGYKFTFAVKRIDEETRYKRYLDQSIFSIMARVDAMAAERLGLSTGKDLDRVIAKHEAGMGAMFVPFEDLRAPLAGMILTTDPTFGEQDGWAPYMITKGRHRMSLWTADQGWT